jgi:hypothetical protein
MKRCPDCGQSKPFEELPRNKNSKDGRHAYCKPCHNARGKETVERLHGTSRHCHLKRRYGIGADEFDEQVRLQGGICLICGRPDPEHVDHDHETGAVRGILCFNCNGGLGQFRDSVDALRAAAAYLDARDAEAIETAKLVRARARLLRDVSV